MSTPRPKVERNRAGIVIGFDVVKFAISVALARDWKHMPNRMSDIFYPSSASGIVMAGIVTALPVLTLILALAPSTRRSCRPVVVG